MQEKYYRILECRTALNFLKKGRCVSPVFLKRSTEAKNELQRRTFICPPGESYPV